MPSTPANSINESTTGIVGFTSTAFTGTAVTNHAVIVGGSTSSTLTNVGPTATSGQVLQSAGSSSDPAFSTATYPATTTINQLLYSSSNNVVGGITAANNGVLISGTTGIPSFLSAGTTGQVLVATTSNPASWSTLSGIAVTSVTGTANQIATSAATGDITLSFPNGISIGSYQATTPPTGGCIMPGKLGVGLSDSTVLTTWAGSRIIMGGTSVIEMSWYCSGAASDEKSWAMGTNLVAGNSHFFAYIWKDDHSSTTNWLEVIRTGSAITALNLPNGVAGTSVANSAAVLINTSTGQLGTIVSSIRYKENVKDLEQSILSLRPVEFNYKNKNREIAGERNFGFIAEEVEKTNPDLVSYDAEGRVETVKYHLFPALLLAEIQKLKVEIEKLKGK